MSLQNVWSRSDMKWLHMQVCVKAMKTKRWQSEGIVSENATDQLEGTREVVLRLFRMTPRSSVKDAELSVMCRHGFFQAMASRMCLVLASRNSCGISAFCVCSAAERFSCGAVLGVYFWGVFFSPLLKVFFLSQYIFCSCITGLHALTEGGVSSLSLVCCSGNWSG